MADLALITVTTDKLRDGDIIIDGSGMRTRLDGNHRTWYDEQAGWIYAFDAVCVGYAHEHGIDHAVTIQGGEKTWWVIQRAITVHQLTPGMVIRDPTSGTRRMVDEVHVREHFTVLRTLFASTECDSRCRDAPGGCPHYGDGGSSSQSYAADDQRTVIVLALGDR
ncbi:MAG TPA: hypothetical protein VIQ30_00270 [Pseudonocardia sp.]